MLASRAGPGDPPSPWKTFLTLPNCSFPAYACSAGAAKKCTAYQDDHCIVQTPSIRLIPWDRGSEKGHKVAICCHL